MAEFKYCIKCLIASFVLVMLMQVHVSGVSLENHFQAWLSGSTVPRSLQKVADGATKAILNTKKFVSDYTNQTFGGVETQRASHFNFELKRNPAASESAEPRDRLKKHNPSSELDN